MRNFYSCQESELENGMVEFLTTTPRCVAWWWHNHKTNQIWHLSNSRKRSPVGLAKQDTWSLIACKSVMQPAHTLWTLEILQATVNRLHSDVVCPIGEILFQFFRRTWNWCFCLI